MRERPARDLVRALLGFAILVASVAGLWQCNGLLLAMAAAECAVALWLWHDALDLAFFGIIGGLGSLAEVVFVHFGVWRYANPSLLGIPIWFPLAFGTTGLIGSRLARALVEIWVRHAVSQRQRSNVKRQTSSRMRHSRL